MPNCKSTALTPRRVKAYLDWLTERERSRSTLKKYRRDLASLQTFLAGRPLSKAALLAWKAQLSERYAPATVNSMLAAVNGYLVYARLPQLRLRPLRIQRQVFCRQDRELNKAEYLRLVQAARRRGNVRLALVLQTICSTGIRVSELQYITAQAVEQGYAEVNNKGKRRTIFLPRKLCRALQRYLAGQKKPAGPVFTTRTGQPLDRSNIWRAMKALCRAAGVGPERFSPTICGTCSPAPTTPPSTIWCAWPTFWATPAPPPPASTPWKAGAFTPARSNNWGCLSHNNYFVVAPTGFCLLSI